MKSGSCRRQLTRTLATVLWLGNWLGSAALGADATQCPEDNPLGGWIRYQSTYHLQPESEGEGGTGCDSEYTQYLRLDMLQKGPHLTHATIDAMLSPLLKGSARETTIQQMLNAWGKHALLDPYYVSRIHYQIWTDGCIKVPGGTDYITGLGARRTSGSLVLGEDLPMGFREAPNTAGSIGFFEFYAMRPEITTNGSLGAVDAIRGPLLADADAEAGVNGKPLLRRNLSRLYPLMPELFYIQPQGTTPPIPGALPYGSGISTSGYPCPNPGCFQVEPTPCAHPDSTQQRDCIANPSKYAVIPFEGKSGWRNESPRFHVLDGWYVSTAISWKICCGCAQIGGTHH